MKLLSVTVPSYNAEGWMRKCIESLLTGGDEVEVIIVNDGSKDNTLQIANEYKERYPAIVRVIDKENGGHGSGVNAGLKIATGLFFKVVDSDDWVDEAALKNVLENIRTRAKNNTLPDMYVTDFVYDHVCDNTKRERNYKKYFKPDTLMSWNEVKPFKLADFLWMHAIMYRTEVARASGMMLPEHTFYVDNIYDYHPLPYVKTICYLPVVLYHYFVGRADQSVSLKNTVARYAQQQKVTLCMTDAYSYKEIKNQPKRLKKYLLRLLSYSAINVLVFTGLEYSKERKQSLKDFWKHIKQNDKKLYRKLRYRSLASLISFLPWHFRAWCMRIGYNISNKKTKFD